MYTLLIGYAVTQCFKLGGARPFCGDIKKLIATKMCGKKRAVTYYRADSVYLFTYDNINAIYTIVPKVHYEI